jgi:signal transduction histidine kinase/CheY-like chemotaxis protein
VYNIPPLKTFLYPGELVMEKQIDALLEEAYAIRVNNLKQSIVLANDALTLSNQSGSRYMIAKSLSRLAFFSMINGEYDRAVSLAKEASTHHENLHDEKGLADAQYTIASVYYKTDNLHLGLKYLVDCLTIYRKYEDFSSQAKCYKALGTIYEYFEDIENAVQSYEAAIEAADKAGDVNMKTNAYNPLSGLYLNQNNTNKALEIIEKSIELKEQTGDIRGLAFAYYGKGKIFTKTRQYQLAEDDFNRSIAIHSDMGEKLGLCMALQKMGILYLELERTNQAKEMFQKALEISTAFNIRMIKTKCSFLLYQVCKKQNDVARALHYLEIHQTEQDANVNNQTQQIVNSYNMIHKMEAKAMQDKMQIEKTEIIEKKNKAEYVAKAKQDFLSNMSHEIRTPLNAIITITNLLTDRSTLEDKQLLDSLRFASNNLLMLINDILDFTKMETGKVMLEKRPDSLANLLNKIRNTYEGMAREKGLSLSLHLPDNLEAAYEMDEIKLTQILGNLLSNAIKFTDRGTVQLIVEKKEVTKKGVCLRFKVTDTGAGIPDEFLGEIFDSFSQAKSVTTKKNRGSGLGLAIVKKLVALHNSDIKVDTTLGKGSTFCFDLLLTPCQPPEVVNAKTVVQFRQMQVLLAEDNAINTLVATKLLAKWGIEAECVRNGIEAVEKAKTKKYDIILMDIHMPEMNGYRATELIRNPENRNNDTPIYALTADITANVQAEYQGYFNGFLHKPIELNQLYQALKTVE